MGEVGRPQRVEQVAEEAVGRGEHRVEFGPAPAVGVDSGQSVGVGQAQQRGRLERPAAPRCRGAGPRSAWAARPGGRPAGPAGTGRFAGWPRRRPTGRGRRPRAGSAPARRRKMMRLSEVLSSDSTSRSSTTPARFSTSTDRSRRTSDRARSRRRPPSRNSHAGSRSMFSAHTPDRARRERCRPQQAGLGSDELGRRPPAEPPELLLDVADQLPGVGRQLLAHRVGGLDQDPEGRHQAAVGALVEQQRQGGPVVGQDPLGHRAPMAARTGGPRSSRRRRARPSGRSRTPHPSADSRTWRDWAPPSSSEPSGWSRRASTVRMSRTTSSACSALRPRVNSRAATRPGRAAGGSGTVTGPAAVAPGRQPRALLERRFGGRHPGVLAGAVTPARDDQGVGVGTHPGEPTG